MAFDIESHGGLDKNMTGEQSRQFDRPLAENCANAIG
jgi:hypothetical protein